MPDREYEGLYFEGHWDLVSGLGFWVEGLGFTHGDKWGYYMTGDK